MVATIARVFLSLLFIYAGAIKLGHFDQMRTSIEAYRIVTGVWAIAAAYFLPWLELWAGLGLLWKKTRLASSFILLVLMTVFTVALISAWGQGIVLSCGCFGNTELAPLPDDYRVLLLRDGGLWLVSIYVLFQNKSSDL